MVITAVRLRSRLRNGYKLPATGYLSPDRPGHGTARPRRVPGPGSSELDQPLAGHRYQTSVGQIRPCLLSR
jgi:hypothetical protein